MPLIDDIFELVDGVFDTLSMPLKSIFSDTPPHSETDAEKNEGGGLVINGLTVPKLVLDQLRNAGVPVSFLNTGQLEAAIQACAIDCELFEDPDGTDFFDDLELDGLEPDEIREREEGDVPEEDEFNHRNFVHAGHGSVFTELSDVSGSVFSDGGGFRQKIKDEREQQKERRKRSGLKEDDASEKAEMLPGK